MSGILLDAGAVIAIDRRDRALWTAAKATIERGGEVYIPSTVVAQVWRGLRTQALVARVFDISVIAPFDPLAREVGKLCGKAKRADICDAHVALVAAQHDVDAIYTSDPLDIRHLLATIGFPDRVVRC
jgi:predicted nucleic acid-binding protein